MESNIERIKAETIAGLKEIFQEGLPENYDLSYITDDLIKQYEELCQEKDEKTIQEDMEGFPELTETRAVNWCFYGHHLVKKGVWWHWQNGNPKSGCDAPAHTCRPGHFWRFKITKSMALRCGRVARNPAFCGN